MERPWAVGGYPRIVVEMLYLNKLCSSWKWQLFIPVKKGCSGAYRQSPLADLGLSRNPSVSLQDFPVPPVLTFMVFSVSGSVPAGRGILRNSGLEG